MKKYLIVILIGLATTTGEGQNILIWNSDTLNLYSNPMELRSDWKDLEKRISKELEKKSTPIKSKDSVIEVFLWPNYSTEWKIEKGKIYLNNIYNLGEPKDKIGLEKLFKGKKSQIFGNWINGQLILYEGDCIKCASNHVTNTSIYEIETVLEFKNGVLKKSETFFNSIKKSQFTLNPNPNDFLKFIYKNIKWEKLPELGNKNFQVFVSVQPNKKGHLKKIDWQETYLINYDENKTIQNKNNPFIREAVRIAKTIPDWDVIIRHKKIINDGIGILFNKHMQRKYAAH